MISKTFLDNTLDWQEKTLDQTQFLPFRIRTNSRSKLYARKRSSTYFVYKYILTCPMKYIFSG